MFPTSPKRLWDDIYGLFTGLSTPEGTGCWVCVWVYMDEVVDTYRGIG
jgi:hypothetical protein